MSVGVTAVAVTLQDGRNSASTAARFPHAPPKPHTTKQCFGHPIWGRVEVVGFAITARDMDGATDSAPGRFSNLRCHLTRFHLTQGKEVTYGLASLHQLSTMLVRTITVPTNKDLDAACAPQMYLIHLFLPVMASAARDRTPSQKAKEALYFCTPPTIPLDAAREALGRRHPEKGRSRRVPRALGLTAAMIATIPSLPCKGSQIHPALPRPPQRPSRWRRRPLRRSKSAASAPGRTHVRVQLPIQAATIKMPTMPSRSIAGPQHAAATLHRVGPPSTP